MIEQFLVVEYDFNRLPENVQIYLESQKHSPKDILRNENIEPIPCIEEIAKQISENFKESNKRDYVNSLPLKTIIESYFIGINDYLDSVRSRQKEELDLEKKLNEMYGKMPKELRRYLNMKLISPAFVFLINNPIQNVDNYVEDIIRNLQPIKRDAKFQLANYINTINYWKKR